MAKTLLAVDDSVTMRKVLEITFSGEDFRVITAENAHALRAGLVVEVANGPTTSRADAILAERGIDVVPDILANAGGVAVSYFEWVQNRSGLAWSLEQVNDGLHEIMVRETDHILDRAAELGCDLRTAAYVHALQRIAGAIEATGTHSYFRDDST